MKLSIISTVYNKEKYLNKHIKSLMNQTYNNIEYIFVDDGSVDKSLLILKKAKERHPEIKIIAQKNQGPSYARKTGYEHATGDLIYFVDSDDFLHDKNTIKTIVNIFKKHSNIDFIIGKIENLYMKKSVTDEIVYDTKIDSGEYDIKFLADKLIRGSLCCKIFKTNIINKSFFIDSRNYEDAYFSYSYYINSRKFYYFNKVIYSVNKINNISLTSNLTTDMLKFKYNVVQELSGEKFNDFNTSIKKGFLKMYLDDLFYSLKLKGKNKKIFLNYLNQSETIQNMLKSIKYNCVKHDIKYQLMYSLHRIIVINIFNSIIGKIIRR